MADTEATPRERKTAINIRVQARYDELMHEGRHGHYETMFRIVHEELARSTSAETASGSPVDDPQWDATDAAHPAWWRGHEHTFLVMCREVNEILDGKQPAGTCHPPWHNLRERLWELHLAERSRTASWECKARKQGSAGGNTPADCDWPFCGCDPHADKVLATIQESGIELHRSRTAEPSAWALRLFRFGKYLDAVADEYATAGRDELAKGYREDAITVLEIATSVAAAITSAHDAAIRECAEIARAHRTEAALERHKAAEGEEKACWLWAFDTSNGIERAILSLLKIGETP